jgi:hypothetical protein
MKLKFASPYLSESLKTSCQHVCIYLKYSYMCGLYEEVGHYTTSQKVAGSIADEVIGFSN